MIPDDKGSQKDPRAVVLPVSLEIQVKLETPNLVDLDSSPLSTFLSVTLEVETRRRGD